MDERRIDTLARMLASGVPRRGILGGLAVALPASLLGGRLKAAEDCKKVGRKCDRSSDCCDGARCENDTCVCKDGRDECDGYCYKLDKDEANCGECGNVCGTNKKCCVGRCVDVESDRHNCGGCGTSCPGFCVQIEGSPLPVCKVGCCIDGVCADLYADEKHCGGCDNACASGERCCEGQCVDLQDDRDHCGACNSPCKPGSECCDGDCKNTLKDRDHCGECGKSCANNEACCYGKCVDVENDENHCGACGNACGDERDEFNAPMACCDGVCVSLGSVDHCGQCGYTCPNGSNRCIWGVCCFPGEQPPRAPDGPTCHTEPTPPDCREPEHACAPGRECCNGVCCAGGADCCDGVCCAAGKRCCQGDCRDVKSDRNHCGTCNHDCDQNALCTNGTCFSCPPGRVVCGDVCCFPEGRQRESGRRRRSDNSRSKKRKR